VAAAAGLDANAASVAASRNRWGTRGQVLGQSFGTKSANVNQTKKKTPRFAGLF
jgi:hypothetical protein